MVWLWAQRHASSKPQPLTRRKHGPTKDYAVQPGRSRGDRRTRVTMKEISLTRSYVALVDDEDYERVSALTWHALVGPKTVYARHTDVIGHGKTRRMRAVLLHRFILNAPPELDVDHRDHNGLNCTRRNLRVASRSQNHANRRPYTNKVAASGLKGVVWVPSRNKFRSRIQHQRKAIFLGYFESERDAALAYDAKAREIYGGFARLNYPEATRG